MSLLPDFPLRCLLRRPGARALALLALLPTVLTAQPATGSVSGRVYHTGNREYVRNAEVRVEGTNLSAFTEDAGFYRLNNVPAGEVKLVVSYTGAQSVTTMLRVPAGGGATQDFDLQPLATLAESVIKMDAYSVTAERDGQAKAIMDQRAALNAKSIVATDNFGDLTMGDVGEFLKYMPGIALDYLEVDTSAVRIGGLDPKYSSFTQDGVRMAASDPGFGAASRRNTFEQMSITGTDVIEFNNTLTASMDADSPAGTINMRSRNSFERKGRRVSFQAYAMGTSDAITLGRSYLPDDEKHYKVFPAGQFNYGDVFLNNRLGVELSMSYNASFVQQDRNQVEYTYTSPTATPLITGVMWRPGPKVTSRTAANFGFDLKLSPELVLSWRSTYSLYTVEFFNQYTWLRVNKSQSNTNADLTRVVAAATNNANTRIGTEYSHRFNYQPNYVLAPRLEWKHGTLTVTARAGYSNSKTSNRDMAEGFFRNTNNRVTRMSWQAERASQDSAEWYVTQLSGPNWSDPSVWGSMDTHGDNIVSNADETRAQMYTGYIDVKKALRVGSLPTELKTGFGSRLNTYSYTSGNREWTYMGPEGDQKKAPVPWTQNYKFEIDLGGHGGNINAQNWRADDTYGTYDVYVAHPEWFKPDTLGNFSRELTGARSVKEEIDAAYLEATTRWRKLRLNGGMRWEHTRTKGRVWDPRSKAELIAAGYPVSSSGVPTTAEGYLYQYRNGQRSTRYGDYDNVFFSGGAKYFFSRNLSAQVSMSESILRPDYNNLAGVTVISETANPPSVTVPNPNLKPETSTKLFVGLQYYFEPAGTLSVNAYRLDVKNQLERRSQMSAEELGYDPAEYDGYVFYGYRNGEGSRRTDGVTVEYDQKLTFVPRAFGSVSVFGSVTRAIADTRQLGLIPKSANGGVRYKLGRFNVQLRSTWQSAKLLSSATVSSSYVNGDLWAAERTLVDVSGGYRLTNHFDLMFSIRNIFNAPYRQYSYHPGRTQMYDVYGSMWNVGVKGTF